LDLFGHLKWRPEGLSAVKEEQHLDMMKGGGGKKNYDNFLTLYTVKVAKPKCTINSNLSIG